MVTRKPVPTRTNVPPPSAPYPTSPVAPSAPNGYASAYQPTEAHDNNLSLQRSRSSSASSHNTWNSGFSSDGEDDDYDPSKLDSTAIPASLRVGQPSKPSQQPQQSQQSHNPYHNIQNQPQPQLQSQPQPPHSAENNQSIWDPAPAPPSAPPPPPPPTAPVLPSLEPFSALSLDDNSQINGHAVTLEPPPPRIPEKSSRRSLISQTSPSNNPWQEDLDRETQIQDAFKPSPSPQPVAHQFDPPPGPPPSHASPNAQFMPSQPPAPSAPPLAFNAPSPAPPAPPLPPQPSASGPPSSLNVSSLASLPSSPAPSNQYSAPPVSPPPPSFQPTQHFASQPPPGPPAPPPQSSAPATQPPTIPPFEASEPLIDFNTEEATPSQPTRHEPVSAPQIERSNPPVVTESPEELLKKQRNETYQIKLINWFDVSVGSHGSMRRSPVLTQNANGPCPLLALVNALTLSAPESPKTVLVDALYSREQISLGLLLDAVFEELARRTEITKKALPDVSDLYSFLITLHTGMNVNPRFVAPANSPQGLPGSFEDTREMRLYSTFDIPLVHGWIPPSNSSAYEAFDRSAKTFDEALNIQFAQAELEHKLGSDGLTANEQQMFEDIIFIKEFLAGYPTQLTEHGLKVIADFLKPGQIAILFRNDHFSTLYKQPRTGVLMNLVTDAGYSSHDEIVWESLVDVNGAAGGLFSGDFRPVGNSATPSGQQENGEGWQTVSRNNRNSRAGRDASASADQGASFTEPPAEHQGRRKTSEQEDADLALALQLQEEEEDNQRREQAARRRQEDELSRQFLDREAASSGQNNGSAQRPPVPPRRSNLGNNTGTTSSNNNPPPTADAPYIRGREDADDEPPTYEQAASDRPFRPSGTTPVQRQGDALGALTALQMQNSPFAANQNQGANSQPPSMHRRRSSAMGLGRTNSNSQRLRRQQSQGQSAAPQYSGYVPPNNGRMSQAEREERCVVM